MRARVARPSHSGCDKNHTNRDCIQPARSDGVRALTKGSGFGPARDMRRAWLCAQTPEVESLRPQAIHLHCYLRAVRRMCLAHSPIQGRKAMKLARRGFLYLAGCGAAVPTLSRIARAQ